jgi:RimJ/RimL family protein N-acetyltransferase
MINYARQVAERVLFHVGVNNIRSQKAMEKLGAKIIERGNGCR